jgi:gliding motility-associated-like protein
MCAKRIKSVLVNIGMRISGFRLFCMAVLTFCFSVQATGQLTARNADGKQATQYTNTYGNRDTIFVFNQIPQPQTGNLSLQQTGLNTFRWYRFDYNANPPDFEKLPFVTIENVEMSSQTNLAQGGYKVTVTPQGEAAPRDSFVAWLYMNPGFSFNLYKDDNGEVVWWYKYCDRTDFVCRPNTVQSSFTYYHPGRSQQGAFTFANRITFVMKSGNNTEVPISLNTQGDTQYLRENSPPYEDTPYYFRAYDMFGIEMSDDIMYRTIIPFVTIDTPVLPDTDPTSAPVPVNFTYKPYNVSEYVWRFGDGDSVMYDMENQIPDTVKHIYYTPRKQGYQMTLKVTSLNNCIFTTIPEMITVDDPWLEVANVFTPNNDGLNDYFKPQTVSLRGFEIWIYTRAGKRVYYYRGDDLRSWEGWDGRIEKSGKDAAEGVYFYTIKAWGWDNPPTRSPQAGPYSGSFHLYR